jgi:hypothetical protein
MSMSRNGSLPSRSTSASEANVGVLAIKICEKELYML